MKVTKKQLKEIIKEAVGDVSPGPNRWEMQLTLTWDVLPEDVTERHPGDADIDFAQRAVERIRPDLENMLGPDTPFAHYHISAWPKRVTEWG
jgi:hypothetical protein